MITNYFKTLSCRRIAPLLFAQSQNADLSPTDAAKLSAHLAHCAACQNEAAQFARMARDLRQATPAAPIPSADLWSRIEAEITTQTSPLPQRPALRPAPFAPRLGGLAWAGSAAIVFVGGAWMTYGAGFWGHGGGQKPLPTANGVVSSVRPDVTLIPPAPDARVASNTGTVAKAAMKKANGNAPVLIARRTAQPVRSRLETRPDPFALLPDAPPSKPTASGALVNQARPSRSPQTNPTTLRALARLESRDRQEAGRSAVSGFAAKPSAPGLTASAPAAAGGGNTSREALYASVPASPTFADATNGAIAAVAPNASKLEPAAVVAPSAAPLPTSVESAAPLGVSVAFAYSSVKPAGELDRASDAPALDDAEPRSIPPAGSGGAFSVGEPTSRLRRQRALFSYGRP